MWTDVLFDPMALIYNQTIQMASLNAEYSAFEAATHRLPNQKSNEGEEKVQ
jgi:hypothetical protein